MNTQAIRDFLGQGNRFKHHSITAYEHAVRQLFSTAGIEVGGARAFDVCVHDPRFYARVLRQGSLGLGESYMDGWWDCAAIDGLVSRLIQAELHETLKHHPEFWLQALRARLFNLQSVGRSYQVADAHYNLGNDLFIAMLGETMCYSSGYWKGADNLAQAQVNKMDLLCRKLELQAGEHVLDIGCGWGSFARYAAEHYSVQVTGITVSKGQQALAIERCKGLPVKVLLQDYRLLEGRFDKVVSVGMFEHVGLKNYPTYFGVIHRVLKDGGLSVLHTIGTDRSLLVTDPWIGRYAFPNGKIPSLAQIVVAAEQHFLVDDVQNFGPDYDTTLMAWLQRFEQAWPLLNANYSEQFRRMWVYYLASCAGAFRSGSLQLFQLVLRHRNRPRPRYDAPR